MNFELGGTWSGMQNQKKNQDLLEISSKLLQKATYKENLGTQWTGTYEGCACNGRIIRGLLPNDESPSMQQIDDSSRAAKMDGR